MKLWQTVFIKDDSETLSVLKIKYILCSVNSNKGFPTCLSLAFKDKLNTAEKEESYDTKRLFQEQGDHLFPVAKDNFSLCL